MQQMLQDFKSESDHFTSLWSKGLTSNLLNGDSHLYKFRKKWVFKWEPLVDQS